MIETTDVVRRLAIVDVGGVRREISLACIVSDEHPLEACVGEWVLVHVGFAMSRINEQEATATLKTLHELGEVSEELAAMASSGAA